MNAFSFQIRGEGKYYITVPTGEAEKIGRGKIMTCIGNVLVSGGKGTINWTHRKA
jgi:hypothetical protein